VCLVQNPVVQDSSDLVGISEMVDFYNNLRLAILHARPSLTILEVSIKTFRTSFTTLLSQRLRMRVGEALSAENQITTTLDSLQIQVIPQALLSEFIEDDLKNDWRST
jgi:VIT1/CCC1 family predicted Fe2+/Mn2+ transporter